MSSSKICILLLAVLSLCGCQTVREARQAQKADRENLLPGERTVTPDEVGLCPGDLLSAKRLEEIALFAHPSVLQARQNAELARLAVSRAKSAYLPTFDINGGYSHGTINRDHNRPDWRSAGSYTAGASFGLLLWDFGKTETAVRQAVDALVAAEEAERSAENKVLLDVRLAHSALKRAVRLHEVALQSVEQYKEHLDQMNERFEVGKGTDYDRVKAEVDWTQSKLAATTTGNNVETAKANLNRCLGFANEIAFEVEDCEIPRTAKTLDELVERARVNEPSLASLRAYANAASNRVEQTIASLWPTISLNVSGDAGGAAWPLLWNLSGLGLVSQNVYNGGRDMLEIKGAVNELRIARSKVAEREQSLFCDLRTAMLNAKRAADALEVAKRAEELAADNLRIVNERFAVGKASSIERTDAQVQHSNAQAEVVTAIYDDRDAQANIAWLIGD